VARGVVRLGSEDRTGLVHAFENPDQGLLVELRTLCQEGRATEVVQCEGVRTALRRGGDDLGGRDLRELQPVERCAEPVE
jgi:hypothetical protein